MSLLKPLTRRGVLAGLAAGAGLFLPGMAFRIAADDVAPVAKRIPASCEGLPPVGLGSWITFNVGNDAAALRASSDVMRAFFVAGGRLIDSSPMYGSSQKTIGHGLAALNGSVDVFSADKVWTSSGRGGPEQIDRSRANWGVPQFDLLQVHNLLSWQAHLPALFAMKAAGRLRYVGITTSHGRRHDEVARILESQPVDFLQLTYNAVDRSAERRLLPLAAERGVAVIVNRPYRGGSLIRRAKRAALPPFAAEAGCATWADFLLKFIISHPAVTCAIPATTSVAHVRENMGACRGPLPDAATRRRMAAYIEAL